MESLGEEWLVLKDNAGAHDPQGPQGLRKLPEKKRVPINCLQHKEEEVESLNSMHQMPQGAVWKMLP
jgi:hypothetical protein